MTDWKAATIKTYDDSAEALADYFSGIGSRRLYIEMAFKLVGSTEPVKVIEIGCGDGRDAAEILRRTSDYTGFDPSRNLIALAQKRLPTASLCVNDALSFDYPPRTDIVFAFASLLHVNREEFAAIIRRLADSLKSGGLLYLSLKESERYEEKIKRDQFGERLFYYYSVQDILAISQAYFYPVLEIHETIGKTKWFELGLKRT